MELSLPVIENIVKNAPVQIAGGNFTGGSVKPISPLESDKMDFILSNVDQVYKYHGQLIEYVMSLPKDYVQTVLKENPLPKVEVVQDGGL